MQSSDIPVKFQVAFASGAAAGFITTPIPQAAQPSGRASLVTGFSELNFDPLAAGGIPPWGKDFNGLNYQITSWLRWATAGGFPVKFDATFNTSIGGYPLGAFLASNTLGHYWISNAENNTTDPNSDSTNWIAFPDVLIQQQAGNFCIDTGTPNAYVAALTPVPASLASIVGSPIRVRAANANTSNTPTIHIITQDGATPVPMVNSNGSNLAIGQIARATQIFEGYLDGLGFFQVTSPGPAAAASALFATGFIYILPFEVVPVGLPLLECDGSSLLITAYPNLYNRIGTRFGQVDPNHFSIPDLRGAFMRGWDHGRGLDPNANMRTSQANGGTVVGDHVGSWQQQGLNAAALNGSRLALVGHIDSFGDQHPLEQIVAPRPTDPMPPPLGYGIDLLTANDNNAGTILYSVFYSGVATAAISRCYGLIGNAYFSGGGTETRPVNIDMMYAIAY